MPYAEMEVSEVVAAGVVFSAGMIASAPALNEWSINANESGSCAAYHVLRVASGQHQESASTVFAWAKLRMILRGG